ncbi:Protein NRT1/ PTR FAMILY 5.3 [Morella rubra]|uniref:Protein NRT1/ PTR FAMILY 5.3 n=1 Tax=Morella rubra TaxID=262757 RepID=A0A6A1W4S9_9ROSI|nr:Protein NRT1/ PTR FAMILY 5.3 [Morella rubra]
MAEEAALDEYTQDGTVDLKGNPVLRSRRGGWKACWFIVVYEIFERMAYYGISSNLILYLTKKLHQGAVTSSNNITNWVGTIWMTPILGAYVADAHLGRYWTFIVASVIYMSGMSLLTLAVSLPSLKPPRCLEPNVENCKKASTLQLAVFYGALYTLAVGTGGTKPNISTIGADQFDDFDPKEKAHKLSFFNWWMFSIFTGILFASTVLVYIQDNFGWSLGYGLPTLGLAVSIMIFLAGTPLYRHKLPAGSPFTRMVRVIVAAIRKWKVPLPNDPKDLYELDLEAYAKKGKVNTLFVKQGMTLESIGSFEIPAGKLRWTKNPRGITLLQRMGIGIVTIIIVMTVASLTERYRLSVAKEHGLVENGGQVPLTVFILLPQYVLMGIADATLDVAKIEFFYDHAPESMKSLGTSYHTTSLGVGNFLSSFLLSTVSHITEEHGHHGWIQQKNLNASHLDYYYAFFVILNFLNLIFFLVVVKFYVYKAEIWIQKKTLRKN